MAEKVLFIAQKLAKRSAIVIIVIRIYSKLSVHMYVEPALQFTPNDAVHVISMTLLLVDYSSGSFRLSTGPLKFISDFTS